MLDMRREAPANTTCIPQCHACCADARDRRMPPQHPHAPRRRLWPPPGREESCASRTTSGKLSWTWQRRAPLEPASPPSTLVRAIGMDGTGWFLTRWFAACRAQTTRPAAAWHSLTLLMSTHPTRPPSPSRLRARSAAAAQRPPSGAHLQPGVGGGGAAAGATRTGRCGSSCQVGRQCWELGGQRQLPIAQLVIGWRR